MNISNYKTIRTDVKYALNKKHIGEKKNKSEVLTLKDLLKKI